MPSPNAGRTGVNGALNPNFAAADRLLITTSVAYKQQHASARAHVRTAEAPVITNAASRFFNVYIIFFFCFFFRCLHDRTATGAARQIAESGVKSPSAQRFVALLPGTFGLCRAPPDAVAARPSTSTRSSISRTRAVDPVTRPWKRLLCRPRGLRSTRTPPTKRNVRPAAGP